MPTIKYEDRQRIIAQSIQEIQFDREFKQGKVRNWKINEDLYYGRKVLSLEARANVDLGEMGAYVHTILAKVDNPLVFKFAKKKDAQLKRVERLNALRQSDSQSDDWNIKDIAGKKQGIIYGRSIYSYAADSIDGYKAHLDNVDVYDYLIDPSAGGLDIERAFHMGRYGVVKTRTDLEEGMKAKIYLKTETSRLLDGAGNANQTSQEETNKYRRTFDQNVTMANKEDGNKDKFKFWEWYTTYEGERYYLLLTEGGATAVRIEKLTDIFESNLWPFWTWAPFPDLTEFWTPGYCDYARENIMARAVSVNQMLDNAEQINKPQRVVDTGAIENLAELKYRKEGYIKTKPGTDVTKAVQTIQVPSIQTPIQVFNLLSDIQSKTSGVTEGDQGDATNNGDAKATIYQGNQANSADRFGLLNKSYSFGYKRFATLYEWGVREHLTKKIAVDILGPNGVDIEMVSKRDIFRKNESFNVLIESSNAETDLSELDKRTKLAFLSAQQALPTSVGTLNQKKLFEVQASIAGFTEEEIRQLLDVSEFGDAELMSEAERDIERILDGEIIRPNKGANSAYKQRFVDYMNLHEEAISQDQFMSLAVYVRSLDEVIMQNTVRMANDQILKQAQAQPPQGAPAAPVSTASPVDFNNQPQPHA